MGATAADADRVYRTIAVSDDGIRSGTIREGRSHAELIVWPPAHTAFEFATVIMFAQQAMAVSCGGGALATKPTVSVVAKTQVVPCSLRS